MNTKTHYRKVMKSDHLGIADLEDFIGVKINKIYHKDVTIPDDDVQTLLERVLDKIKKHKADGAYGRKLSG